MWRTSSRRALALAALLPLAMCARPLHAQDDDGDFGSQVFEGEPAEGRPLEGVPDESRRMESQPSESMPLDVPLEGRVTDSEANDGPTIDRGPRELIPENDESSANGSLREAEPADDDSGVAPGPRVNERVKREDGY